ncbi:MAG: hypothetical protein MZV65_16050 [Chromatiales bacterium]|nr:hypothetical protein [Chromatiales bacterium]
MAGPPPRAGRCSWSLIGLLVKARRPGRPRLAARRLRGVGRRSLGLPVRRRCPRPGIFALFALALVAWDGLRARADRCRLVGSWAGWAWPPPCFGALYAVYQEDIKKHPGLVFHGTDRLRGAGPGHRRTRPAGPRPSTWRSTTSSTRAMLFLAIAGVIQRVGHPEHVRDGRPHQEDALHASCPCSMAIIALSGVPPLSGFGGKWLLYSTLIRQGLVPRGRASPSSPAPSPSSTCSG